MKLMRDGAVVWEGDRKKLLEDFPTATIERGILIESGITRTRLGLIIWETTDHE